MQLVGSSLTYVVALSLCLLMFGGHALLFWLSYVPALDATMSCWYVIPGYVIPGDLFHMQDTGGKQVPGLHLGHICLQTLSRNLQSLGCALLWGPHHGGVLQDGVLCCRRQSALLAAASPYVLPPATSASLATSVAAEALSFLVFPQCF